MKTSLYLFKGRSSNHPFFRPNASVICTTIVLIGLYHISFSQIPPDSMYFGQTPPCDSAIVFAPGIISLPGRNERTPNYLPDYSEFYFTSGSLNFSESYVYQKSYTTMWEPVVTNSAFTSLAWDLSVTDSTLACFTSQVGNQTDIFTIERTGGVWGSPVKLPSQINSGIQEWGACILQNKTVYFCRYTNNIQGDIFRSVYAGDSYLEPEKLEINTPDQEWDPYIPEDESYIIFKSDRPGGFGSLDLYITYRKEDGTYTNPKNLGSKINTSDPEDCGNLTPDSNYFLFARGIANTYNRDIYWVSSGFIDSLRLTNFIPYTRNPIPNQIDTVGNLFNFIIPDSTFIDDNDNETLALHAGLESGDDLPEWLYFDTISNTFSGTPLEPGFLDIMVTATDIEGETCLDVFRLTIVNVTSTKNQTVQHGFNIYPVPATNEIYLEYPESTTQPYYKILDLSGNLLIQGWFNSHSIDVSILAQGIYILNIACEDIIINKRILIK